MKGFCLVDHVTSNFNASNLIYTVLYLGMSKYRPQSCKDIPESEFAHSKQNIDTSSFI